MDPVSTPQKQIDGRSLTGRLLVAAPSLQETIFARAVIYLCAHDSGGAMGVIINHPVENLRLNHIFDQVGIAAQGGVPEMPVHFGGPVEMHRGFIVFPGEYAAERCVSRQDGIAVTGDVAVLEQMATGGGPARGMLVLGYAGWGPGQLEKEIEEGSWIVASASEALLFSGENKTKWNRAMSSVGIDLGHFSSQVGHA